MAPITRAQKQKKMGPIRAFPSEYTDSGRTYENPIIIEDDEEVVINESRRHGGRRNFDSNCQQRKVQKDAATQHDLREGLLDRATTKRVNAEGRPKKRRGESSQGPFPGPSPSKKPKTHKVVIDLTQDDEQEISTRPNPKTPTKATARPKKRRGDQISLAQKDPVTEYSNKRQRLGKAEKLVHHMHRCQKKPIVRYSRKACGPPQIMARQGFHYWPTPPESIAEPPHVQDGRLRPQNSQSYAAWIEKKLRKAAEAAEEQEPALAAAGSKEQARAAAETRDRALAGENRRRQRRQMMEEMREEEDAARDREDVRRNCGIKWDLGNVSSARGLF